jgi:hypothetical protein
LAGTIVQRFLLLPSVIAMVFKKRVVPDLHTKVKAIEARGGKKRRRRVYSETNHVEV